MNASRPPTGLRLWPPVLLLAGGSFIGLVAGKGSPEGAVVLGVAGLALGLLVSCLLAAVQSVLGVDRALASWAGVVGAIAGAGPGILIGIRVELGRLAASHLNPSLAEHRHWVLFLSIAWGAALGAAASAIALSILVRVLGRRARGKESAPSNR